MKEWWRGAVIYPRSYLDSNADGIGDLSGIIDRLDHVASLGVDGIWLSPFFPSPMKDFGYDVADYCGVDPMFGTLDDFERLLAQAHRRGLRLIIDQVYSHSSDQHPWFLESRMSRDNPKADWYVWADPKPDGTPPNNWLSVFGGASWDWEPRRKQYYFHNFLKEQPDLNFHNPEVQEAILRIAEFWLDCGVDGFRIDVANLFAHDPLLRDNPPYPHSNPVKPYWLQRQIYNRSRPETLDFVARLRATMDRYPEKMAVAEIASDDPIQTMVTYTDGPNRYHTAYSFAFLREPFGAEFIRRSVQKQLAASPTAWPAWAFSNHDVPRAVSRWTKAGGRASAAFANLLIALLTTLRGTAFLYQGEELGLPNADVPFHRLQDPEGRRFWPEHKGRDCARTPMPWRAEAPYAGFSVVEPWLPVDPAHHPLAVDRQQADPCSTLNFTRRLLRWRKQHRSLITGDIRFLDTEQPVLAFERCFDGERVLCAFNLGPASVVVPLELDGRARPIDELDLAGELDANRARLPGYGAVFALLD